MTDRTRTILIAPDSFKGSLTSVQVARALAEGWQAVRPDDTVVLCPLADGGEGTLEAIAAAGGWTWQTTAVRDPIGRTIDARWLRSSDGTHAAIEMAEASGLSRLTPSERDAVGASSVGTGDLVRAALDAGVTEITLGIGGSATTDGGCRAADRARGRGRSRRRRAWTCPAWTGGWRRSACRSPAMSSNPLLGPSGAAAIYGPQKGADPDLVDLLDGRLATFADAMDAASGRSERDTPGAGAAGGVGYALLSIADRLRDFALRPGVDLVMEAADFDGRVARADLVITGEGRIDAQTGFGKTALGVARRAAERGVPCIAVGGGVEVAGVEALAAVGTVTMSVTERPQTIEAAMARARSRSFAAASAWRGSSRSGAGAPSGPCRAVSRPRARARTRRSPCCRPSG